MDAADTLLKTAMAQHQTNPALYSVHYAFPATRISASPSLYEYLHSGLWHFI